MMKNIFGNLQKGEFDESFVYTLTNNTCMSYYMDNENIFSLLGLPPLDPLI